MLRSRCGRGRRRATLSGHVEERSRGPARPEPRLSSPARGGAGLGLGRPPSRDLWTRGATPPFPHLLPSGSNVYGHRRSAQDTQRNIWKRSARPAGRGQRGVLPAATTGSRCRASVCPRPRHEFEGASLNPRLKTYRASAEAWLSFVLLQISRIHKARERSKHKDSSFVSATRSQNPRKRDSR